MVEFLIDTGSPINIMDQPTYERLRNPPALDRCGTTYYAFKSKVPIPTMGQFCSFINSRQGKRRAEFVVVKGEANCLLGYRTTMDLGIFKFVNQLEQIVRDDKKAQVAKMFPYLFTDKIGCLKGYEVKLEVDETVKPVRQAQRPVPFHIRGAVEREIGRLVQEGVLELIDHTKPPPKYISNIVVVPKGDGKKFATKDGEVIGEVRITADGRALNKAIIRTKYPSKTIDDLIFLANGGVEWSVLDIRKAFHQIALAKDSRYWTAITTHVGLFQYNRMHMGISCESEIFTEKIRVLLRGCPGQHDRRYFGLWPN